MRTGETGSEILIVGAGPTGLTLANALAFYGTPFSIIDSKPGPTRDSKALAINAASRFGLDLIGLRGLLGKRGARLYRLNIHWQGKRLSAVDLRHLKWDDAFFITQPQSDTEYELIAALEAKGHNVAWNTRLLSMDQENNFVRAAFRDDHGCIEEKNFAYVVGCDGKASVVRRHMPVQFHGHNYPMYFVLGDFALTWDASPDQAHYFVYQDRFFIFVPAGKDLWRVVVKYDGLVPDRAVQASDITNVVSEYCGHGLFRGEPAWLSRAPFYMRVSDRLRHGRLFLAGDAAHLFSPIGGTGMNTGMQDALNISWKLAYLSAGRSGDELLNSYELERLHVIRATAKVTDQSTRLISRMDDDLVAIEQLLPKLRNRTFLRHVAPLIHSGLGLSYAEVLNVGGGEPLPGSRRTGELCLHYGRLFAQVDPCLPPFMALVFVRASLWGLDDSRWFEALAALQEDYVDVLRVNILAMDGSAELETAWPMLKTVPVTPEFVHDLGAVPGAFWLVSPDGVIRFSGLLSEAAGARRTLERYLTWPVMEQSAPNYV